MTLRQQLNQIDVSQCVMTNGRTVEKNFINEAHRLKRILKQVFSEVLDMRYKEVENPLYERTGQLLSSIIVDKLSLKINTKTMSIDVGFSKAGFHHSGDGLDGEDGRTLWYGSATETFDVATAFYEGYQTAKPWFSPIYTFGWRPKFGFHDSFDFMQEAINRFQDGNWMGITINIVVPNY